MDPVFESVLDAETRVQLKVVGMQMQQRLSEPWTATATPERVVKLCSDCDDDRIRAGLVLTWVCHPPGGQEAKYRAANLIEAAILNQLCFERYENQKAIGSALFLIANFEKVQPQQELSRFQLTADEEEEAALRGGLAEHRRVVNDAISVLNAVREQLDAKEEAFLQKRAAKQSASATEPVPVQEPAAQHDDGPGHHEHRSSEDSESSGESGVSGMDDDVDEDKGNEDTGGNEKSGNPEKNSDVVECSNTNTCRDAPTDHKFSSRSRNRQPLKKADVADVGPAPKRKKNAKNVPADLPVLNAAQLGKVQR